MNIELARDGWIFVCTYCGRVCKNKRGLGALFGWRQCCQQKAKEVEEFRLIWKDSRVIAIHTTRERPNV